VNCVAAMRRLLLARLEGGDGDDDDDDGDEPAVLGRGAIKNTLEAAVTTMQFVRPDFKSAGDGLLTSIRRAVNKLPDAGTRFKGAVDLQQVFVMMYRWGEDKELGERKLLLKGLFLLRLETGGRSADVSNWSLRRPKASDRGDWAQTRFPDGGDWLTSQAVQIRFFDTKTHQGRMTPWITVRRIRAGRVSTMAFERADFFSVMHHYERKTRARRAAIAVPPAAPGVGAFLGAAGSPAATRGLGKDRLANLVKDMVRGAGEGLGRFLAHDLRSIGQSIWLAAGRSLQQAAARTGHSAATARKYYARPVCERLVAKFGKLSESERGSLFEEEMVVS